MGIRERRPDAASVVLAAGTEQVQEEQQGSISNNAPLDMKTGQSAMTCLRREVPTDHEARSHTHAAGKAAGTRATTLRFDGIATWKPNRSERTARSHPHSGPRRERTKMDGDVSRTAELWRLTRSARRGGEWCWETTKPRAAREVACGRTRHAQANSLLIPKARSHAVAEALEQATLRCNRRDGWTAAARSSCETRTRTT